MKESGLFCKLLNAAFVIVMACLVGLPNDCVGAITTKEIVEGCLSNSLYREELSLEEVNFVHNLGFKDYKEFRSMVGSILGRDFFAKYVDRISGCLDNVRFVCFINLIVSTPATFDKTKFIRMLISNRTREERREDRVVAKIIDENLSILLANLSPRRI